jgi:hypothetical protein
MMNINDIEKKNAANERPVRDNRNRPMLALLALVSLSALLSPVMIEDKHELSADSYDMMLAQDENDIMTAYTGGGWTENEAFICAMISIGAIIVFAIVYFGSVRERK